MTVLQFGELQESFFAIHRRRPHAYDASNTLAQPLFRQTANQEAMGLSLELRHMTASDSQLTGDLNRGAEFLRADIDIALTFAAIASSVDRDEETRLRNQKTARKV